MKIALCSSLKEPRQSLVKEFISRWPMYKTPAKTIDDDIEWPDDVKQLDITKEKLNDIEKALFSKMILLSKQYADYKDEKFMIYDGCSIDILLNTIFLSSKDLVSDEFVEKIIYHNKNYLKNLDAIYWLPRKENEFEDIEDEDERELEKLYHNMYDNYYSHFNDSIYFDQKHTPGYIAIETESPLEEMAIIVDDKGNFISDQNNEDVVDMQKMMRVLKNKSLIESMMKGLNNASIPIIGE